MSSNGRHWRRREVLGGAALGALSLLLPACKPKTELIPALAGGMRLGLPDWKVRSGEDELAAGFVERVHERGAEWGRVGLAWEVDPRVGVPKDELLLRFAALGAGAHVMVPWSPRVDGHLARGTTEIHGHGASLVGVDDVAPEAIRALVWRCDKTGRLVRLYRAGRFAPTLEDLAADMHCHGLRDRPVNGEVPNAAVTAMGEGWYLAKRNPASASYLKSDAVFTVFAGQMTLPPDDLVEAAHLAAGWCQAEGLTDGETRSGERAAGPQSHPALRLRGTAKLDGKDVRWTSLQWRCVVKKRTFLGIVFAQPPAVAKDREDQADWTSRDAVLLAARCHGS
ncbi:MAG: hypothetical protein JST92_21505 [Deltaproteobacteria bacterium]|nr:hypothetical protein [Deltaproteobacteria bacterium]